MKLLISILSQSFSYLFYSIYLSFQGKYILFLKEEQNFLSTIYNISVSCFIELVVAFRTMLNKNCDKLHILTDFMIQWMLTI